MTYVSYEGLAREAVVRLLNKVEPDRGWWQEVQKMPADALPAVFAILSAPHLVDVFEVAVDAAKRLNSAEIAEAGQFAGEMERAALATAAGSGTDAAPAS